MVFLIETGGKHRNNQYVNEVWCWMVSWIFQQKKLSFWPVPYPGLYTLNPHLSLILELKQRLKFSKLTTVYRTKGFNVKSAIAAMKTTYQWLIFW